MTNILVYTFRTFPYLNELKKTFPEIKVFGKLKDDLNEFFKLIDQRKPDFISGIAFSKQDDSF